MQLSIVIHTFLPRFTCLLFLWCTIHYGYAQKYNFINFNVENGLAQSQAITFAQNPNNELLIGTYGGLSVFDGTNFTNFNKSKGLPQNIVNTIACDKNQTIWIGTPNAVSRFNGQYFTTFYPGGTGNDKTVAQIIVDGKDRVWVLMSNRRLYKFDGRKFVQERRDDDIYCMTLDNSGKLWIATANGNIDVFDGDTRWHREINNDSASGLIVYKMTFGSYSGTLYALTTKGVLVSEKGKFRPPDFLKSLPKKGFPTNILEDKNGNIWISFNDGGAWMFGPKRWTHYTYQNGFTDDNVERFFEDAEGNIWLATNGSGIYRYTGSIFTYYDRGSGLSSPSVMSIAQARKGPLYFAGNNSGLYQLVNNTPVSVNLPFRSARINSLVTDSAGTLWIATNNAGLWSLSGSEVKLMKQSLAHRITGISNLHRYLNTIWITSRQGLFRMTNDTIIKEDILNDMNLLTSYALNDDSLLIGTLKGGAFLYRTDTKQLTPIPSLGSTATLCFSADNKNIYIGTDDRGVVIWNRKDNSFTTVGHRNGLSCDYIYSLLRDRDGNLWVGTGCGIDRITIEGGKINIKTFGRSDGLLGIESNINASFEDREGFLWFGTTRGVFRYNPYVTFAPQQAPKVILQSVKLFAKDIPPLKYADSIVPFSGMPWNLVLPTNQNHLTFTYKGIYLSQPEKIRYRYQLAGIDRSYTETNQTTVVYPNLPPGDYLFKVWASDADGNWYDNAVSYPFRINRPFHSTWYFRLSAALAIAGLFLGGVYYRNRQKERRRKWEERLREEEQALVRKKTAEDFHDEIGNKLTRINLLATIAENKMSSESPDVKSILKQIQTNISSLYQGSKDIIWLLQPESDYLDGVLLRIEQNTSELIADGSIQFRYHQQKNLNTHIKLPIDYSRNLILIFKEAVNNIVKHAHAHNIHLSVTGNDTYVLCELSDDGSGFDSRGKHKGNGIANIRNRANRIGAKVYFESRKSEGTRLRLYLNLGKGS